MTKTLINLSVEARLQCELKPWQARQNTYAKSILRCKSKESLIRICCSQSYPLVDQPLLFPFPLNVSLFHAAPKQIVQWRVWAKLMFHCLERGSPTTRSSLPAPLSLAISSCLLSCAGLVQITSLRKKSFASAVFVGLVSAISSVHVLQVPGLPQRSSEHVLMAVA